MSLSVYSKNLQIFNAEQFKESVSEEANSRIYFTYGRSVPWSNEANPPQANTSVTSFNEVWSNMIGAKLLTGNDIRHVVKRINWVANTIYDAYDHCSCSLDLDDNDVKFYVVTSDWNVYKCLSNNNGGPSLIMPTSLATVGNSNEADGYVWKYMYTISPAERLRFTTDTYMPVKILTSDDNSLQWDVQSGAVAGALEVIKIDNAGQNYTSNDTITLRITGDGANANAYAIVNTVSNTISSVYVDNPGRGYTYANVIVTDAGTGTGAVLRGIISPPGGHGSDPLRELGGSNLILNMRIQGSETDRLLTTNEYRQISLMKDPLVYASSNIASNTVASQLSVLTVSGTSTDYEEDELVYQGIDVSNSNFRAVITKWDAANGQLYLSNVEGSPSADILIGFNSAATRFVSAIENPTFQPYTGRLLYIHNIKPITRAEDQTEDFRIILKF
jgi:hypothetical protein